MLFDLPDELFVSEAYLRVLARHADPRGYVGYLTALRKGLSRPHVIRQMQLSGEWSKTAQHSRGELLRCAPDLWPGPRRSHKPRLWGRTMRDLLMIEGDLFVRCCCWLLLERDPHADELRSWHAQAAEATCRPGLLKRISGLRTRTSRAGPWWALPARLNPDGPEYSPQSPGSGGEQSMGLKPSEEARLRSIEGRAAFTIATSSYMPFVRTLMASLREIHPETHRFLLLLGEPLDLEPDPDWVTVGAAELGLSHFEDMTLRYDVTELATALKPFFIQWLLEHTTLRDVIYLDPDVRLYAPLRDVHDALEAGAAMVLTPHIGAPLGDAAEPSDHTILKSGAYNLGFVAVRRHPESLTFVAWWAKKLRTAALVDFGNNLFTDQRWCDLAPALVPSLKILHDPACNVAYWNLPHRPLSRWTGGQWRVRSQPLVFFHFSGFDPGYPERLSRHQSRSLVEQNEDLRALLRSYADELLANGWRPQAPHAYTYDQVDGVHWSASLRRLYRELNPSGLHYRRTEGLRSLLAKCGVENGLSALMRQIHAMRADLQSTFDLSSHAGREGFAGWFWSSGIAEHGLADLMRRSAGLTPSAIGIADGAS